MSTGSALRLPGLVLQTRQPLRLGAWSAAFAATLLGGCVGPFASQPADYGHRASRNQLHVVQGLTLSPTPQSAPVTDVKPETARKALAPPLTENDTLEITIEQVRAWTLTNNLDLKVSLYDPSIAQQSVSEEEARYEATIFSDLRVSQLDQPTASELAGSAIESISLNSGVRIPMRTGGEVTVSLPVNRTKTNNQFTTLNPAFTADLEVSVSQPLLRNAGRRANTHFIRIAALQRDIADARTKLQIVQTLATAERAYWLLYAVRRELEVRQQQYELAVAQLERAHRRVRAGIDPEIEVTRAQEGIAQRLEAIIISENSVLQQQRDLKRIMRQPGLEMQTDVMLIPASKPDPVAFDLHPDKLVHVAFDTRMELLELELQLAVDNSTIDYNRNQALPKLDLTGMYRRNGLGSGLSLALDTLRGQRFEDWIFTLNAEAPIGNQAAESRLRTSMLQRLQRIATKEGRQQTIEQEVLNAIDAINADWRRILAARQSSILAGRTLQGEERQFDVGARTSTEVLDAAARLADAQSSEIRAVTDYQNAQIDLAVATGTLLGASKVDWTPIDLPRNRSDAPRIESDSEYGG